VAGTDENLQGVKMGKISLEQSHCWALKIKRRGRCRRESVEGAPIVIRVFEKGTKVAEDKPAFQ